MLTGVAERLEERDYTDWAALSRVPAPTEIDHLVAGLTLFARHAVHTDRTRTLARYALFLEAQTNPVLLESMRRSHERLLAWAATILGAFDADATTAKILADYLDGLVMHQLFNPTADFDPTQAMDRTVRALLG
nr:TetR/AcrR family transcriptional regulator [Nocardia bovistercoris]